MKLITKEIEKKLSKNKGDGQDKPYLKLFSPAGGSTWLISKKDGDLLFGLCDLGQGCPEVGYVSLKELEAIELPYNLKIERDLNFEPKMTLSEYADKARAEGGIYAY